MRKQLTGFAQIVQALAPVADAYASDPTTDYVNLGDYRNVAFILEEGVGTTGTATITVLAASDSAGTGATAIPFYYRKCTSGDTFGAATAATAAGFTTTAGSNHQYVIEVDGADTLDGKPWVAMNMTEVVDDPVVAGVTAVLFNARFEEDPMPTAIA